MYFPESDSIAKRHPDLLDAVDVVDELLGSSHGQVTIVPRQMADELDVDEHELASACELMAEEGVLVAISMGECPRCHSLIPESKIELAAAEEVPLECAACRSRCSASLSLLTVYRFTQTTLERITDQADTEVDELSEDVPISDRASDVLVAMLELDAINSDRRQTTAAICSRAFGSRSDSNSIKAVMKELAARRLANTKEGRGGGCWLSPKGQRRAAKLRQNGRN